MARADVISRWQETQSFAVISTARRLRLSNHDIRMGTGSGGIAGSPADGPDWDPFDYLEVDNRGNKGAIIFWAVNGRTASSALATAVTGARDARAQFRLYSDNIDRVFIRATSISVIATGNATTIFVTAGRY